MLYVLALLKICEMQAVAQSASATDVPYYPARDGNKKSYDSATVEKFSWQEQWGTIHMNSFADGLLDPGSPTTANGVIPCTTGAAECADIANGPVDKLNALPVGSIAHGIKYDIKNSVLNCMSVGRPNFPSNNGGWTSQYSKVRCDGVGSFVRYPSSGNYPGNTTKLLNDHGLLPTKATYVYSPIWDPRSNDERDYASASRPAGCQQQIINNCVEDIHDCRPINGKHDPNPLSDNAAINRVPGYTQPVTHVFTPTEVADLGGLGQAVPMEYYAYTKAVKWTEKDIDKDDFPPSFDYILVANPSPADADKVRIQEVTVTRKALSKVDPEVAGLNIIRRADGSSYGVELINKRSDPNLERIESYAVTDLGDEIKAKSDISGLIIVDPSKFFDMKLYAPGGLHDSNYKVVDTAGYPKTPDSCPILGLQSGYSGICDPTGEAGCNLPVYGVGPKTTFTAGGVNSSYDHYEIKWSGYVKKWSVITVTEYLQNVANRKGPYRGQLYAGRADLNDGPILMLTRSNSYCDSRERFLRLNPVTKEEEYLSECIQYKQYQNYGTNNNPLFGFVDLFQPKPDPGPEAKLAFSTLRIFDVLNDEPNAASPLLGNGKSGTFFVGDFKQPGLNYISFLETTAKTYNKVTVGGDGRTALETPPALERKDYVGNPKYNTKGGFTIGDYVKIAPEDASYFEVDETKHGTSLQLEKGVAYAFRLPDDRAEDPSYSNDAKINREDGHYKEEWAPSTRCTLVTTPPSFKYDSTGRQRDPSNKEDKAILDLDKKMFIPTNTPEELDAFLNSTWRVPGSAPEQQPLVVRAGFNSKNCRADYMEYSQIKDPKKPAVNPNGTSTWIGLTKCEQLTVKPSCNQTQIITAQRFCMLEDGIRGQCDECRDAVDIDKDKVDFSLAAVSSNKGNAEILQSPTQGGSKCWFAAACFNNGAVGCPPAHTPGGHVFCLSSDTLITLADGSKQEIVKIKSGDRVLAFKAESSKAKKLESAMVLATAITKDQPVLRISYSYNEQGKSKEGLIRITPQHKMVLSTGRGLMAQDLRAGDVILTADGVEATVEDVENEKSRITVYNLVLEDGFDGYIAGDLRVLSYPILDGMKVHNAK
jgi:hypothetical protein